MPSAPAADVPAPHDAPASAGVVDGAAVAPDDLTRHVTGVFRFLRCLGASHQVAEDLTQEAFVIVWQKGKQHVPGPALGAFLRRTARFLWLEHRRGERRAEAAVTALALQLWEHECPDDGDEVVAAARHCVRQLRGRALRAVELAYGSGVGRGAIARELGMLPNGVKTLLARTRAWLERCIQRTTS